jgi:hypothetical protein
MVFRPDLSPIEIHLTGDQLKALDAWRAKHRDLAANREDAIKHLVQSALSLEIQQEAARRSTVVDEGLRPEQLTSENDV